MGIYLLVQTCENFGSLYYKESYGALFKHICRINSDTPGVKCYVLTRELVVEIFSNQREALNTWQNRCNEPCHVFLPCSYANRIWTSMGRLGY